MAGAEQPLPAWTAEERLCLEASSPVESSHALTWTVPRGTFLQLHPGGRWEELVQPARDKMQPGSRGSHAVSD